MKKTSLFTKKITSDFNAKSYKPIGITDFTFHRPLLTTSNLCRSLNITCFTSDVENISVGVFPTGVTPTSQLVCVLPFLDGDAKRHKDLSWFGQEKALRPAGVRRVCIILHLSACTGVNTSVVWSEVEYGSSTAYECCGVSCVMPLYRSRASPFIVPRRSLGYKYRRQSRGR